MSQKGSPGPVDPVYLAQSTRKRKITQSSSEEISIEATPHGPASPASPAKMKISARTDTPRRTKRSSAKATKAVSALVQQPAKTPF